MHLTFVCAFANVQPWGVHALGCTLDITVRLAKRAENEAEMQIYFLLAGFPC